MLNQRQDEPAFSKPLTYSMKRARSFYLAGCAYADGGGTIEEFREITNKIIEEFWNDDAESVAPVSDKDRSHYDPASSPSLGQDQADSRKPSEAANPLPDPIREPSKEDIAAAKDVDKVIRLTILQSYKIDGRPVGNFTFGEAIRYGKKKTQEGYILTQASRVVANPDHSMKLEDAVKVAEMEEIIKKSKEIPDAAG